MLEKHHKLQPKAKTIDELKVALPTTWEQLPQEHINIAVANFTKCLIAFVAANSGYFEHLHYVGRMWIVLSRTTHIRPEKIMSVMLKTSD